MKKFNFDDSFAYFQMLIMVDEDLDDVLLNWEYDSINPNLSFNDVYLTTADILDGHDTKIDFRGLYHSFYNKMVNQLKQKPRIRNIHLNLTQADIASLDFTKLIFLDGVYYRLNKIIDFKPHLKQSTKVELVEYFELGKDSLLQGDKFSWEKINDKF